MAGSTTIVVTHDQEEAMSLAEHVIVMDEGRIMQQGTPTDIYARPANKFVAEFIGRSNWFAGLLGEAGADGVRGFETADGLSLWVPTPADTGAALYEVCVRPERIAVGRDGEAASPPGPGRNALPGRVADAAYLGADVHLFVELDTGQRISVVEKNLGQAPEREGDAVILRFGADDCIIVPAPD